MEDQPCPWCWLKFLHDHLVHLPAQKDAGDVECQSFTAQAEHLPGDVLANSDPGTKRVYRFYARPTRVPTTRQKRATFHLHADLHAYLLGGSLSVHNTVLQL